jgi:hypothetical protein
MNHEYRNNGETPSRTLAFNGGKVPSPLRGGFSPFLNAVGV